MPPVIAAELLVDAHAEIAEGPLWDPFEQTLLWAECLAGVVHRLDPATGADVTYEVGQLVGSVSWTRSGALVVAMRGGFALLDRGSTAPRLVAAVEGEGVETWMNDGACDRAGRFWAGTASRSRSTRSAALYRLDPNHSAHQVVGGIGLSNGIGWSPDDRRLYHVDSAAQGVDVFDFDLETAGLRNRRRLVDVDPAVGIPDGLTVDVEGCIWLAVWGSSRVWRYTPTGRLDRVVTAPVSQVTSCTFGGRDLDQLLITSAAEGLSVSQRRAQPYAGGLFRADPGISGLPPQGYAG